MIEQPTLDTTTHNSANLLILSVSTFGAIVSHLTASNVASGLTILLALVGLASYYYNFKLNVKKNENEDLEKKKLQLEIKELEKHATK